MAAIGLFLLFDLVVAVVALFIDSIFAANASHALLYAAPVAGGLALETSVPYRCQGARRSALLATRNLIARPLTLALVIGAHLTGSLTVAFACWAFAFGSTVSACAVFACLRPTRRHLGEGWAAIRHGMNAPTTSHVPGTARRLIDVQHRPPVAHVLLTSAAVGYYALAFSLVAPITLGVQSIAIAGYGEVGAQS